MAVLGANILVDGHITVIESLYADDYLVDLSRSSVRKWDRIAEVGSR